MMWTEPTPAGTYKYSERFTNEYTGEKVKVSITRPKDDPTTRRVMPTLLYEKYLEKYGHTEEKNAQDITYGELIDKWLAFNKKGWKASTYRSYQGARNMISDELKQTLVSKLNATMINRYLNTLHSQGSSNSSMSRRKGVLSMALQHGIEAGHNIDHALPSKIRMKRHKLDRDKLKYLTMSELETVERQLMQRGGQPYADVIFIQATTGIRVGEALALRLKDIDIGKDIVHVRRTYDEATHAFDLPKSGSVRDAYMLPAAKERLMQILDLRKSEGAGPDDMLFLNRQRNMVKYSALMNALRHHVSIKGKKVTSHIFRHTYITLLIDSGMPFHLIAYQVGHEDTRMIEQIYGHYTDNTAQQLKDHLANLTLK